MRNYKLIIILIIAAVLRLFALGSFPAGLNADEAALGYNAYSLMLTGKDEHGHPWPINLESFGDFKPALYAYVLIPFVKVFGLTEFAVRLPSALAGIVSIYLIYLLSRQLFPSLTKLPYISAFLLAISPWHLQFSRGAWEVNLATTFILAGVYLYIKNRIYFSTVLFILSLYTYQSAKIIAPLLALVLFFVYPKSKKTFLAGLLALVLLVPLIFSMVGSDAGSRFNGVGILADEGPLNRVKELRGQHSASTSIVGKLLHNRPIIYTIQFFSNYLDHFNGDFLFINGDTIQRNKVPETGLLYFSDAILLVIGGIYLLRYPTSKSKVIWLWLFIAPLAAAITFQTPHALRAQNMIIPLTLLIALGVDWVLRNLPAGRQVKIIFLTLIVISYVWQVSRYLHEYYVHYPQTYPSAWEYGFKELLAYVTANQNRYEKILVTDKYDQPYILFLFYSKYPPSNFQGHHVLTFRDQFNFSTVRDYDKFHFSSTPWNKVRDIHPALIIAAPEDIPPVGVNIVKIINFPNGQPAFKIISN